MDYQATKNLEFLDKLLQAFNSHATEPGVIEALEHLKAARINYQQRSIDHMLQALMLSIQELIRHPPSSDLARELMLAIQSY